MVPHMLERYLRIRAMTAKDVAKALDVSIPTALRYLAAAEARYGDTLRVVMTRTGKRGPLTRSYQLCD